MLADKKEPSERNVSGQIEGQEQGTKHRNITLPLCTRVTFLISPRRFSLPHVGL